MNRKAVGIGCGILLLLLLIPIGLVVWAFSSGVVSNVLSDLNMPTAVTGQSDDADGSAQSTPRANTPVVERQLPNPGSLAEPVIAPPDTLADLYDQVNPGAVSILVGVNQGSSVGGSGAGSGFVLTDTGYIVTNDHVVEGGNVYIVRFYNDVDVEAELVGADPDSDIAILKVAQLPEGVYPLPLGDSSAVRVGESVVAIGNPFSLGTSMSYGIVSAVGRTIPSITPQFNIPQAIQTDAAINPGNSGGPLINMNGEVIGINAQIQTGSEGGGNIGIGFAIPVDILKVVYPSLIESGRHTWAYLGVSSPLDQVGAFSQQEAAQLPDGAFIADVVPGGPSATAGLQPGDVVTAADGQPIANFEDLLTAVAFKRPGDTMTLTVFRNGQEQQITVTLGERPSGGQ